MSNVQHSTSSGIYIIRCKPTGKVYVGSAINIHVRWQGHRLDLAKRKHHSVLLQRAWEKYGPDAFEFVVLIHCLPEQLIKFEQHYIDTLKSCNPKFGFNLNPIAGSFLGHKHSEKTRAKMAAAKQAYFLNMSEEARAKMVADRKSRTHSTETRAKMSDAQRGRIVGDETRAKLAAALQGKSLSEEIRAKMSAAKRGKAHSDEHRRKISEALQGRVFSEEWRRKLSDSHRHLSDEQYDRIRQMISDNVPSKVIAQVIGCSKSHINNIKSGHRGSGLGTWKHEGLPLFPTEE